MMSGCMPTPPDIAWSLSVSFYVRESRPLLGHGINITIQQKQLARFNISYCIHKKI